MMDYSEPLSRIEKALEAATETLKAFTPGAIESQVKAGGDPVTEADLLLDKVLKAELLAEGEGWLSEETRDDHTRLDKERVWIVDPLDGTREFIEGIPEWCVSIAYIDQGIPQAAGICNPATGQTFLGTRKAGVTLNGKPVQVTNKMDLAGATVLASRSEVKRGQWQPFEATSMDVIAMGSVAYKMACVSAGLYDATFTLVPKNEWDVAAGCLLVEAAGGKTLDKNLTIRTFNQKDTLLPGLIACHPTLQDLITALW